MGFYKPDKWQVIVDNIHKGNKPFKAAFRLGELCSSHQIIHVCDVWPDLCCTWGHTVDVQKILWEQSDWELPLQSVFIFKLMWLGELMVVRIRSIRLSLCGLICAGAVDTLDFTQPPPERSLFITINLIWAELSLQQPEMINYIACRSHRNFSSVPQGK